MVSAEFFEDVGFAGGAGCGDDAGTGGFGELQECQTFLGISPSYWKSYLQSEHADSAGSLCEYSIARLQRLGFQPIKAIPRRQRCTRQRACLLEIQRYWHVDQSLLVKRSILTQCTIDLAAQPSVHNGSGDGSTKMSLIEQSQDLIAALEPSHACANGFNSAGSIGSGDDAISKGQRIFALSI